MSNVHVIDHPLVQHKLTLMRKKTASTSSFRRLLKELAALMTYEITRDMPMQEVEIETPLEAMKAKVIDGKKLRDMTGAEFKRKGGWLSAIGAKLKAKQKVGDALSEAEVKGLQVTATGSFPGNLSDPTAVIGPVLATKPQDLPAALAGLAGVDIRVPEQVAPILLREAA